MEVFTDSPQSRAMFMCTTKCIEFYKLPVDKYPKLIFFPPEERFLSWTWINSIAFLFLEEKSALL